MFTHAITLDRALGLPRFSPPFLHVRSGTSAFRYQGDHRRRRARVLLQHGWKVPAAGRNRRGRRHARTQTMKARGKPAEPLYLHTGSGSVDPSRCGIFTVRLRVGPGGTVLSAPNGAPHGPVRSFAPVARRIGSASPPDRSTELAITKNTSASTCRASGYPTSANLMANREPMAAATMPRGARTDRPTTSRHCSPAGSPATATARGRTTSKSRLVNMMLSTEMT